jgi:hypothetical protein
VEVWLALPDRAAIDVTKFGERLMWIGCNERLAWAFEFDREDGTALRVAGREGAPAAGGLPVDPALVIALAGLVRLPDSGTIERDGARDAWVLTPGAGTGALRLSFDRRSMLPLRVEVLDENGSVACYSRIERRRYEALGPLGSGPMFPTLVDVFGGDGESSIKLALRDPGPDPAPRGYFDVDWLSDRFRPARVAGFGDGAAPGTP